MGSHSRSIVAGLLALGALCAACTGGAAKDVPDQTASSDAATGDTPDGMHNGRSLSSGARVAATLQSELTSRTNKSGETVLATVSANVKDSHGRVVIPAGSAVALTLSSIETATETGRPNGRVVFDVNSITVNNQAYAVTADLDQVAFHLVGQRDVIVSAGTPITFTLTQSLNIAAR